MAAARSPSLPNAPMSRCWPSARRSRWASIRHRERNGWAPRRRMLPRQPRSLAVRAFLEAAGGATRTRMRGLSAAGVAQVRSVLAPMLRPCPVALPMTGRALGVIGTAAGVAAPFGRLEAEQLRRLAALAEAAGATELRLSPWRTVYFGARDAAAAAAGGRRSARHRPDRRFARSAAAHRGLSRRARLQVEQRRCARRCATAGGAGRGRGLRRQHPCLGLRQGLCAFRAVRAGAGRQGGTLSPGAQRHDARPGRTHHRRG